MWCHRQSEVSLAQRYPSLFSVKAQPQWQAWLTDMLYFLMTRERRLRRSDLTVSHKSRPFDLSCLEECQQINRRRHWGSTVGGDSASENSLRPSLFTLRRQTYRVLFLIQKLKFSTCDKDKPEHSRWFQAGLPNPWSLVFKQEFSVGFSSSYK